MTRSSTSNLELFDLEIERTFRSLRKLVKEKIATVKEESMERQGVNVPAGAGIGTGNGVGVGVGIGAGAIQNAPRTFMDYAQPSLLGTECHTRPGEIDTWQPPRALEWVLVFRNPFKDSQGTRHPSPFE